MDPLLNHKILRPKKEEEDVNVIRTRGVDSINPNLVNSITNSWISWVRFDSGNPFFLKSSIENLNVSSQNFLGEGSLWSIEKKHKTKELYIHIYIIKSKIVKYFEKPCYPSPHKLKEIKRLQMKKATKKNKKQHQLMHTQKQTR